MSSFKLVTWNVNSIRIRLDLLELLVSLTAPDIICLQEVKAKKEDFPFDNIRQLGYEHIALYGQAGYNGVAILSKFPLLDIEQKNWVGKQDARHIKATIFDDIEIVSDESEDGVAGINNRITVYFPEDDEEETYK